MDSTLPIEEECVALGDVARMLHHRKFPPSVVEQMIFVKYADKAADKVRLSRWAGETVRQFRRMDERNRDTVRARDRDCQERRIEAVRAGEEEEVSSPDKE